MNKNEKIILIIDRINQIDIHIDLLQNSVIKGHTNKIGQLSFEDLIQIYLLKKQALEGELNVLNNQDNML